MRASRQGLLSGLGAAALMIWGAAPVAAQTTYTSRASWEAAVSGSTPFVEMFDGFAADTEFRTQAVNTPNFSLRQIGSASFRNQIDVPPNEFGEGDGTANASLYTNFGLTTVEMGFAAPLAGWGADFFEAGGGELLDLHLVNESGGAAGIVSIPVDNGFFGFTAAPGQKIAKIVFTSRNDVAGSAGQGFALDNVSGAFASPSAGGLAPEPVSLALFLPGLAVLGVLRRRKQ